MNRSTSWNHRQSRPCVAVSDAPDDAHALKDNTPLPLVFRHWPLEPSAVGKVYVIDQELVTPD